MELQIVDWIIISSYLLFSLLIGLRYRSRASKSMTDYFLSGRKLPWWIAGLSMVATTFAADTPLAVTELVSNNGISGNWIWWNMLFGGMLTTFFFARLWRRAEILTEVEFIEFRYQGRVARFLRGFKAVYLGLFMNILVMGWVNLAMISILMVFFNLDKMTALYCVGGIMLLTAGYSALSGLWGVAITDAIQFVLAMGGCIVLAVIVVNDEKIGGISGLKEKLPTWSLDFFPVIGTDTGTTARTLTISLGAFLAYLSIWWASWYPGAEPGGGGYVAQRMMSAKNEKHSLFATLFFQTAHYALRPWPWILVGLCCLILYPELSASDKKLGYVMAMKDFLPAGLKGLLLVAFLAAYMSTIATQLNWGTSYLVNDLYKRFIRPATQFHNEGEADKHYISVSRYATLIGMSLSLLISSRIESISGVWSFIIECGAGLGAVLILRWYWWRINAWSELTATLMPFVAYALARLVFDLEFPDSFFFTTGLTTLSWLTVTFLTPPENPEHLKNFYRKVQPGGWWKPIQKIAGAPVQPSHGTSLLICWLSAVCMTYSFLFFSGKFIFQEWTAALAWAVSCLVSMIILRHFAMKSGLLG